MQLQHGHWQVQLLATPPMQANEEHHCCCQATVLLPGTGGRVGTTLALSAYTANTGNSQQEHVWQRYSYAQGGAEYTTISHAAEDIGK